MPTARELVENPEELEDRLNAREVADTHWTNGHNIYRNGRWTWCVNCGGHSYSRLAKLDAECSRQSPTGGSMTKLRRLNEGYRPTLGPRGEKRPLSREKRFTRRLTVDEIVDEFSAPVDPARSFKSSPQTVVAKEAEAAPTAGDVADVADEAEEEEQAAFLAAYQ